MTTTTKSADLGARFLARLENIIADTRSTSDRVRNARGDRDLLRLHPRAAAPNRWMCQLCGHDGQTIDCTYPCDTIRVRARVYGITESKR